MATAPKTGMSRRFHLLRRFIPGPVRSLRARWLTQGGLRHGPARGRAHRAASQAPTPEALTPILVDYYTRDGSTAMMRLLASSPQIAVEPRYPYETKYFAYLWRWSRLVDRGDWPEDQWGPSAFGSITLEQRMALMGPPPWPHRTLAAGGPGDPPLGERCFELAWREFSRRAAVATRVRHGQPQADVRYYAEKHLNTWLLDLRRMPDVRLLVLLRDPRDVYVSIGAFNESRGVDLGQRSSKTEQEFLDDFTARQRERLRWIARLLEESHVPVIRYSDLVLDPAAVARRIADALGVRIHSDELAADRRLRRVHTTASDPTASIGRWRAELEPSIAEQLSTELAPELAATGLAD